MYENIGSKVTNNWKNNEPIVNRHEICRKIVFSKGREPVIWLPAPKNSEPAPALRATAWSQLHIGSPKKEPQLFRLFFEGASNFGSQLRFMALFPKNGSGAALSALLGAGSLLL